ncbi:SRPBCC family protein [Longimicrobium terrae]|uniref:Uncharacterized protein YndB with AHSA1/START domain n=1 Tax=Longimicrobium terrae TaxID=1639882 RepID=A0A841GVK7_9BACT|nr:SRPBCC domain-containing protein [Longimicrobium terrae]MBB4635009.1 uncharacterized protein YndB with AHSA1/START domain [Longimicrobium terrae]MBB6069403.1 uncharacterized protein YndB with AHSA1/START domain [Longimicrobium terrae]NNC31791.1 SRPBCC domain-containing protein [Longimicrobium terrae]
MMMQTADALTLRVERVVRASRERVYAAWTTPEIIQQWSAPQGMTIGDGEMDVSPGGRWRVVMLEPNGTRHEAFGVYRQVIPPEKLVYTHQWHHDGGTATPETTVTVEFVEDGPTTRVVLTQEGFGSAASRDGHGEGWGSTMDRLVELFQWEAA